MEAIWNLEDKWRISTRGAVVLLAICTCSLVIGTCIIAALRRKVRRRTGDDQEPRVHDDSTDIDCSKRPRAELSSVLTSSVRWSQKDKLSPLLVSGDQMIEADFGWQSRRSSDSPVWKRPILMGEKCKLPKFSGLILYDQRGHATSSSR
ncbi:hypothetical protein HAX54_048089 [Datura stramonium]|uniref:Transmembrane protein n=1 Tax=Datura stramonium TaxID=4076 RepID=A0ABS8RRY5_DATST|nr:hypothetical protein [Datura stramonium]